MTRGESTVRKIKVILKDDAYNPTRALANLQEMKGNVFAVCGLLGTAILNASKDFFQENKIPLITAYGDVRIWEKMPRDKLHYVFIAYPDYEDEAEYLTKYGVGKLGSKKLALFYQNDDYGKEAMGGVKKALEAMPGKGELVGAVPYEVTERSLGTHALKLKETGADTVIIYTTPTHGALILKEMAKIDYRPKALATFTLGDPIMYKVAGDVWEGTYIALPGNSGVPGADPDATKAAEILLKYDPKIKGKEYLALFGAVSMMHLVEGLKKAGKDLDSRIHDQRHGADQGLEARRNWRAGHILAGTPARREHVPHESGPEGATRSARRFHDFQAAVLVYGAVRSQQPLYQLWRHPRSIRRGFTGPGRRDLDGDRSQRIRQDNSVQLYFRSVPAHGRGDSIRRGEPQRALPGCHSSTRDCSNVSKPPAFSAHGCP